MKALFSSILASLAIASPALAQPLPADHQRLVDALTEEGIQFVVNSPAQICFEERDTSGSYITYEGNRAIVVCQDNRINDDVIEWTDNDLDTIRHEAIHAAQDCIGEDESDGVLDNIFTSYEEVIQNYGIANTMRVMQGYSQWYEEERHEDIQMEVEAFYGAATLSADQITSMFNTYCGAK